MNDAQKIKLVKRTAFDEAGMPEIVLTWFGLGDPDLVMRLPLLEAEGMASDMIRIVKESPDNGAGYVTMGIGSMSFMIGAANAVAIALSILDDVDRAKVKGIYGMSRPETMGKT